MFNKKKKKKKKKVNSQRKKGRERGREGEREKRERENTGAEVTTAKEKSCCYFYYKEMCGAINHSCVCHEF